MEDAVCSVPEENIALDEVQLKAKPQVEATFNPEKVSKNDICNSISTDFQFYEQAGIPV